MTETIKRLKNSEVLKRCGLSERASAIEDSTSEVKYYRFMHEDKIISVQCTAPDVAEGLTKFFVDEQTSILIEIVKDLAEPGDFVEIENDNDQNPIKVRIAQVVRLKGSANEISLLISR